MINFRYCESNHKGSVPLYDFKYFYEFEEFVDYLFKNKKDNKKVYVCFNTFRGNIDYSKGEQDIYSILITCQPYYEIAAAEMIRLYNLADNDNHKFDYSVFEYSTYNEAFLFCKDLMDGITKLN